MAKVKISELPSLTPATLDTTFVVGISGSTTYKISINQLTSSLDTTFATDLVTAALSSSLNSKLSTSSYSTDSSSFDNRIKNSQPIGYLTTASYTTDSSSFNSRIISGSVVAGTISSSAQITAFGFLSTSTDLSSLNTISASYLSFTQSYYSASSSFDSRVDSLENATSSYLTSLNGVISGSTQISALGFVTGSYTTINSFNNLTQSFNSISQSFTTISGSFGSIDFSGINAITSSYLSFTQSYYSASASFDSRVDSLENATSSYLTSLNGAISNSAQILNSSGIFSSSAQLPVGLVSGSSQILNGSSIFSSSAQLPTGIISSSAQLENATITNLTITNLTTVNETSSVIYSSGSNQLGDALNDTQILSGSIKLVGTGSLNGYTILTSNDTASFLTTLNGAISSSTQVLNGSGIFSSSAQLPTGLISSSTQLPSNLISGSSQISTLGFITGSYISSSTYTTDSSSFNSRIISGSAVAGTISGSAQISALGYATTSSVTTISASAWGAFQSASSYSSSLATSISASNYNITINSASVSSISSSFVTSISASNASITALSSSNATTDNTQTTNITAASASAWGAFQSASSYSSSVSTSLSLVSASLQSSISASNYNITINSASVSSLSSSFNTRVSANSASAWGAFQTASANSSSLATSITSVSGTFTNLTVNGQPTTYGVVNPAYLVTGLVNSVNTLGVNQTIILDTTLGNVNSQVSYNNSTGIYTLAAGVTYEMSFTPSFISFSNTTGGFLIYQWVDATTNTPLDSTSIGVGTGVPYTDTGAQNDNVTAKVIYTPSTNQTVKLYVTSANGTANLRGAIGTQAIIKPLNLSVAVQATATGTVAATIITDTNPVSTSNNGGSSTSPGLTILTLAIPSAGTWRLDSELRVYVPGAGYMAAAFYDNGTLIPGSEYFVAAGGVTQTGAATGQYSGFMSYDLTTTSARTVTVGIWSTTSANAIASEDGRTWARATKIDSTFALNALDTMQITNSLAVTGSTTLRGAVAIGTGSGFEGGEINLAYAQTTSLTGSVLNFDVYQDRLRIFEGGGNSRGAYLNVASQSNSVGSSIVTSPNLLTMQTITSASYAALTPVSGTLYIIIG